MVLVFLLKYHRETKGINQQLLSINLRNDAKVSLGDVALALAGTARPKVELAVATSSTPPPQVTTPTASDAVKHLVVAVKQKDNLNKVFKRVGLASKDAAAILALKKTEALRDLRAGKKLNLTLGAAKGTAKGVAKIKLLGLAYKINELDTLEITAKNKDGGWSVKTKHIEPTVTVKYATSKVGSSIYSAGKKAGVSQRLMAEFVGAFDNKISVSKIHGSDSFAMFYKEYTVNGKKVRDGVVVAAEITHKGQKHRVIGFSDIHGHTDFYTPDGHSVKPSFVRYPMTRFRHVGSRFSLARVHPILGTTRPHLGVDFAADVGSPVKATSNGRVVFAGHRGDYGRAVIIKHGIYGTLYAHLSRIPKDLYSGKHVRQGDVVGYVGSSGLTTGPHLHYEFHVNGVPKDPLKVKLPAGEMIASEYRGRFFAQSKKLLAQLDLHHGDYQVFAMSPSVTPPGLVKIKS